ncbi:MAG: hypothetical protein FWE70_03520 [Oscillospiraceae bacterium]|nr:hypothetical protein [Oscillospiraceae bacterium]
MTSRERVLTALRLGKPDRVPFMEWYYDREVGDGIFGGRPFVREDIAEALCMDGIGTYAGPPVYAEKRVSSAGREYEAGGLLKTRDDLSLIRLPNPRDPSLLDHVKRTVERYGDRFFIFLGTNSGADCLLRGMGLDNFSYALQDDLGLVEEILDIYSGWCADMVAEAQKTGIDAVWLADDIAFTTALMFSAEFFREVVKPRMRRVMDGIRLPSLYHSDGDIGPVMDDLIELGFNGIHPIDPTAMDIGLAKARWGGRVCLVGNIDLSYTLVLGTPEEVETEVRDRVEKVGYNGGFILSSANSLTDYCPTANVLAMRDALLKYGAS